MEACALELELAALNIYVVTVYNFNLFLNGLDSIIKSPYKAELKVIVCGGINTDYLADNEGKKK
jgi:hypothetical protein